MGNEEGVKAVTRAANTFASKFLKTIAGETAGNLICSPLSASMVLSMAAYGARANTEQEMRATLALPADDNLAKAGFQSFIDSFKNYKHVELRLANKIFLAERFTPKAEFMELTKTAFHSEAQQVDFTKSIEASRAINAWCEGQTNNRIKDFIRRPDALDVTTTLVLLNAVYFKGNWASKFNVKNTKPRPFHSPEYPKGTTVDVPTMYRYGNYKYGVLPEVSARFLKIPYKSEGENDKISMFVILPDQVDGLPSLMENIEKVTIEKLIFSGSHKDVHLYLPKFKIESTIILNRSLITMGMAEMFTSKANFSGIADLPLYVSIVIQKAFIEVNEEGSEAAAVTGMIVSFGGRAPAPQPMPVVFNVDRPALVLISAKSSPLFAASVSSP